MHTIINRALDQLDSIYAPTGGTPDDASLGRVIDTLQLVQDAYVETIQLALRSLMQGDLEQSHDILQSQRDQLIPTFDRIAASIEDISETGNDLHKLMVEYLYTRARLIEELKMFPHYGLELLERLTIEESIDATIEYMEVSMTGRKNLYPTILSVYAGIN